jgi:predicted nucleotidyltransferase
VSLAGGGWGWLICKFHPERIRTIKNKKMKDCINIVKEIVLKRVPLADYSVFLFGSRAVGNNHEMSDIDVGIWGEKPLSAMIKLNLEEELEESDILLKVDLIDFYQVSQDFKDEALTKIETWNYLENLKKIC